MTEPHTYSPDPCPTCGEGGCCDPNYGGLKPCDSNGIGIRVTFVPDDSGGHIEFNGKIWRPE